MAIASIEERIAALESEAAKLKTRLPKAAAEPTAPWWEQRFGAFAESEAYDDAARLGREYRESLRPLQGNESVA